MSYADTNRFGKTGKWVGEVKWLDNGIEHRLRHRFDAKKDADKFEAYVGATHELPPWLGSSPTSCFATIAQQFKASPKGRKWSRNITWTTRLEFAITHLGSVDVRKCFGQVLVDFAGKVQACAGRGDAPPSNYTVNAYLQAAGTVLDYAAFLGIIPARPRLPREANTFEERRPLTWGEEDAVCHVLEERDMPVQAFMVRVLGATGMRAGELFKITPDAFERGEQAEYSGIGLKREWTKTKKYRFVPLVPEAAEKLRALIANRGLPSYANLARNFKKACKRAGLDPKLCLHCLRHSTATRLNDADVDLLDRAKILGHSTGMMTERYTSQDKARLFQVAKKVQQRCGEITPSAEVVPLKSLAKSA